jgi:hypothetical protein
LAKCSYTSEYQDYDTRNTEPYKCPVEEYSDGLCKFHHSRYAADKKNKEQITELLKQEVERANTSGKPLKWIGYQIPSGFAISSEFKVNVYLSYANFIGDADFSKSTFERIASFSSAQFNGRANFSKTHFKEGQLAVFSFVKFNGEADFSYAHFNGEAYFFDAQFKEGQRADFSYAHFNGVAAYFSFVKFNGEADFSDAHFNGEADFFDAHFNGEAYFFDAQFKEGQRADFSRAHFNGVADFSAVKFNGVAYFSDAHFNGEAKFDFSDVSIKGNIILTYVSLKEQENVFFNGDLSNVSFANTDITRVRFGDKVQWGRKKRNSGNAKPKEEEDNGNNNNNNTATEKEPEPEPEPEPESEPEGAEEVEEAADDKNKLAEEQDEEVDFKIYDEWLIEENIKKKTKESPNSLESVIAEYRNLRENYEYNLRYEEAGQFFIREMELRRKYEQQSSSSAADKKIKEKNIFKQVFSFAFLYYFVSKYGESNLRPFIIIASIFVAATVYFWYTLERGSRDIVTGVSDSITRTLTTFFPFLDLPPNYGLLEIFLKAIALAFTGLFIVTLRRKLERRFRH